MCFVRTKEFIFFLDTYLKTKAKQIVRAIMIPMIITVLKSEKKEFVITFVQVFLEFLIVVLGFQIKFEFVLG